jgi:hypothetical protein
MSTLRGAGVAPVNVRRLALIAQSVCLVAIGIASIVLFVVGAHQNAQITELRQQGIPVVVTVTSCRGQLGGSGSNDVGFTCTGNYTVGGRRYVQDIPDGTQHAAGAQIQGVTVRSDPNLLSTPSIVAGERASAGVYILPAVLSALCVLGAAPLIRRLLGLAWGRRPAGPARRGVPLGSTGAVGRPS